MIPTLRYFVREALTSMGRTRGISLLAVGTICIALTLLGSFLYVSSNLQDVITRWTRDVQLNVYLEDDIGEQALESLRTGLVRDPAIERVVYVSKEEALSRFRDYFADLSDLPDALGLNPLPASLEVRLAEGHRGPEEARRLADDLRDLHGVEEVQYDTGWVERLSSLVRLGTGAGYLLGGILLAAATFTTSNVIRLALYSRQDEVEILRLVGATRGFIQGPFLVEGFLQGTFGGLLALAALGAAHGALGAAAGDGVNLFLQLASARFLDPAQAMALVGIGSALGLGGSFLAVRRFLQMTA